MVRDLAPGHRARTNLDGARPPLCGEARRDTGLPPRVVRLGAHREGRRLENQVRRAVELLSEVPDRLVWPGDRGWHIFRIASRRTAVDPAGNRVNLLVRQRAVVLEVLDTDGTIEMPRGHLPRRHTILDGPRPGPRILIGHQRHWRDRVRSMTGLALGLKDRRNILRKSRHRLFRRGGGHGTEGQDHRGHRGHRAH